MRYFSYLNENELGKLFFKKPGEISLMSDKMTLAYGMGATLYFPAVKPAFSELFIGGKIPGLMSSVICLEDSIDDSKVQVAEDNLKRELRKIHEYLSADMGRQTDLPLAFIRVRSPEHMEQLLHQIEPWLDAIAGFVLPKFVPGSGERYLKLVQEADALVPGRRLYGMPILESPEVIHWETRRETLSSIFRLVEKYDDHILNVRIGATDFSGLFGLRRGHDYTVYDIQVLRDCITDILNVFTRSTREYVVSGPVWEYFWSEERILKPRLRVTPFRKYYGPEGDKMRNEMLNEYVDGLLEEVLLDKLNGIVGKTVIHPSHIIPVQSMYCVTHEDYLDALNILQDSCNGDGVAKSSYSNRMNEKKPHVNWARKICSLSNIYGVLNPDVDHIRVIGHQR